MSEFGSQLAYLRDPRLTAHATSALPTWLWSADATRVLWANPVAAAIFNAPSSAALAGHVIDPKGTAALQIARLAASLPHGAGPRLERLRGFGARFGQALMCACSRVMLADRTPAILVVATEPAGPSLTLADRARRLIVDGDDAIAAFSTDGALLHASPQAQPRLGSATNLVAIGATPLAAVALAARPASGRIDSGVITLDRIGADAATVLVASFADAPAEQSTTEPEAAASAAASPTPADPADAAAAPATAPAVPEPSRRQPQQPLRFVWQMDDAGRFTLDSEEFLDLIGPKVAAGLGRPWNEVSSALALDPDGQVARAVASRDTWSGITVTFPGDGRDDRLPVELSGLPVFDRDRSFRGYRGFGVCRDVARLAELTQLRGTAAETPPPAEEPAPAPEPEPEPRESRPVLTVVPPVQNVVPFRTAGPPEKPPTLTPVERKAFGELGSRLKDRLRGADAAPPGGSPEAPELPLPDPAPPRDRSARDDDDDLAARSDARPILDRLPIGVLVYRLDNLLYANRAFLDWTGYAHIGELMQAGGLDALFVEPGVGTSGENGTQSLAISTHRGDTVPV